MKPILVTLMLAAVMLAGCTLGPGTEGDDEPTPPADPTPPTDDDATVQPPVDGLSWDDIPLAYYKKGQPIRINATEGVNVLRVQVNDTGLPAAIVSNTTVDHIIYVYHGAGPFDPDATCSQLTGPTEFEFHVGDVEHNGKAVYGSSKVGEHLVLVAAAKKFQTTLFFGSGNSGTDDPVYESMNIGGELNSAKNSTTAKYPRDVADPFETESDWFLSVGAIATQAIPTDVNMTEVQAGDTKGTLTLTLDDEAGCTDEDKDQVEVEPTTKGTTKAVTAIGGMWGTGANVTVIADYDRHDAAEQSTVKWTFAWFPLPSITL